MKNKLVTTAVLALSVLTANAQNPFVQTWYTSDPAPLVHGDRMYVYTGHDEDKADFFWMQDWRVYSTDDMVNWQDHGSENSSGTSAPIVNSREAWLSVWL